jgi:hypothetical protein
MGTNSKEQTAIQKEAMLNALEAFDGNVKNAALDAKISERTHYRWCREDNNYNNAVGSLIDIRLRHAKEMILDKALLKIEAGDSAILNKMLTIFYKNFTDYEQRHYNNFNDNPWEKG